MWLRELKKGIEARRLDNLKDSDKKCMEVYFDHKDADWIKNNQPATMLKNREMPHHDYFYNGDAGVSREFWKRDVAKAYGGQY